MSDAKPSRAEQIVELLVQELRERLDAQQQDAAPASAGAPEEPSPSAAVPAFPAAGPTLPGQAEEPEDRGTAPEGEDQARIPALAEVPPPLAGPFHAAKLMWRLAIWLLLIVIAVNIPFNRHGTTLATAMPDTASLVIRDGFVVKEEDDPEIYVYQNGAFRWISSMEAFEHYGYTWEDVHLVPDGYLDRYSLGTPIHVLLKCQDSPHIYRLEGGEKRWIRDIDVFTAEGHLWEDVRFVSCEYLRNLPDGEPIPPDAGPPPQP
jgi:hypothetical protein